MQLKKTEGRGGTKDAIRDRVEYISQIRIICVLFFYLLSSY
jgi:hypothetical protein